MIENESNMVYSGKMLTFEDTSALFYKEEGIKFDRSPNYSFIINKSKLLSTSSFWWWFLQIMQNKHIHIRCNDTAVLELSFPVCVSTILWSLHTFLQRVALFFLHLSSHVLDDFEEKPSILFASGIRGCRWNFSDPAN